MLRPIPPQGCLRAPVLRVRSLPFAAVCLTLAALATPTARAEQGTWTSAEDWSGGDLGKYAIHLLLMPEANNPDRSRILWFAGQYASQPFRGGEWRWGPGNDDCSALHPAGGHATTWDLRDASAVRVHAGVYVCRMIAGDFRARQNSACCREVE